VQIEYGYALEVKSPEPYPIHAAELIEHVLRWSGTRFNIERKKAMVSCSSVFF
jgi:hypothetical protein